MSPTHYSATAFLSLFFLIPLGCGKKAKENPRERVEQVIPINAPVGENSALPFLFSDGEKLLLSWVEKKGDSLTSLKYSQLTAGTWQEPEEILQGTDWFVNWADFPMIIENRGNLWSHVLKKSSSGTYSYDVKMNVRPKEMATWNTDRPLHSDGTPTEHGFVTALPYGEAFFVTWLDGRNTQENEVGERGAMTVRAATVFPNGTVGQEWELDERTCDCCQTTAAITENGPVVLYRDRSEEEIRDISIVRYINGQWTRPKTISEDRWNIKGCPVNGPKAAALGNQLVVAWFTGAQATPRVQMAFSGDGGAHFEAPIPVVHTHAMGRVDVLLTARDTAIVSWMETKDEQARLMAQKVSRSGRKSKAFVISNLDASRKTGFPQMEVVNDIVYFAWTAPSGPGSKIHMAQVSVGDF